LNMASASNKEHPSHIYADEEDHLAYVTRFRDPEPPPPAPRLRGDRHAGAGMRE